MKSVRFVAAARREFIAELAYYREVDPAMAVRFNHAVEETIIRACSFPTMGSPGGAGTRRVFVRDFPFAVIYRIDEDGIVIFALAHHARRPGYWRTRDKEQ